jgi:predicted regulator of Ras-like GTPase activity (Roadblock/LC7/MglB family)
LRTAAIASTLEGRGGWEVTRESLSTLKTASVSFLSAIDPDRGLDAALFVRRTGLVLASWTRQDVRLEVVSVMAATMLASIDTIVETIGAPPPKSVWVDGGTHRIVATKVGSQAFLVVIAPKAVSRRVVRGAIRDLVAHLESASKPTDRRPKVSEDRQRINVRPPR